MQQNGNGRGSFSRVITLGLVVVLIVLLGRAVFDGIFSIRSIEVRGNYFCSDAQVIAAAGIELGDSIFSVKADRIRAGINANRYLEYVSVWRNFFPCSVVLTVQEHTPIAKMSWMGMLLLVGENGVVLERTSEIDINVHVPEIVGMTVDTAMIGQEITYSVPGQGDAIRKILDALTGQNLITGIAQINISTPDNIALVTDEGLQILLGDVEKMSEKIAVLREALPQIYTRGGVTGGVVHISGDTSLDFMPYTPGE